METPSNVNAVADKGAEPWNADTATVGRLGCSQGGLEEVGFPTSMRKAAVTERMTMTHRREVQDNAAHKVTSEVSHGPERTEEVLSGAGPHSEASLSAAPQRRHWVPRNAKGGQTPFSLLCFLPKLRYFRSECSCLKLQCTK